MNETEKYFRCVLEQSNPNTIRILTFVNLTIEVLLALTATLGNGMIIVAILRSQNLQTPSYLLITSLAFTDLLVGLLFHPLHIAIGVYYLQNNMQDLCDAIRELVFVTALLGGLSLTMVTCISIDRYLALTLRHRYTIIVTKKRVRLLNVVVWIVFVLLAFLKRLAHLNILLPISAPLGSFTLLSVTCVCYIKSFKTLHLYTVQVHAQQANPLAGNFDVMRYKKTLKTMLAVLVCLLLCFLPGVCFIVVWSLQGGQEESLYLFSISLTLFGLHSSINPIIYVVRFTDIRSACRQTLSNYWTRLNKIL